MLGIIDIIVITIMILSVLFALYRGLVRELLGIAAWLLAGFAALYSYAFVQPFMQKIISNQMIAGIVGALGVALIVLVVMTLINANITGRLRASALSGLDRILGFAFGIFRAGLLIAVIYIGASMVLSEKQLEKLDQENISMPYIQMSAKWMEKVVPETVLKDMKAYEQGKLQPKKEKKLGIDLKKTMLEELETYKKSDRQSLDEMIEEIAELGKED